MGIEKFGDISQALKYIYDVTSLQVMTVISDKIQFKGNFC